MFLIHLYLQFTKSFRIYSIFKIKLNINENLLYTLCIVSLFQHKSIWKWFVLFLKNNPMLRVTRKYFQ